MTKQLKLLTGNVISPKRAALIARQQLRGIRLSTDDDFEDLDDVADPQFDRLQKLVGILTRLHPDLLAKPKDAAALILQQDHELKMPDQSDSDFLVEVTAAIDALRQGAENVEAEFSMNPNGNMTDARAEEIVNGMFGGRTPNGTTVKLSTDNDNDNDAQARRYDELADGMSGNRQDDPKGKGVAGFIERMTPAQRKRFAELNKRSGPLRAQKKQNEIDFLLDCMEQNIASNEQTHRRGA